MKLYVGNLSFGTSASDLEQLFAGHGSVASCDVITDRDTGQSRGFAFVQMESDQDAKAAIEALDGREVDGRNLRVNEARPRAGGGDRGGNRGGGGRW